MRQRRFRGRTGFERYAIFRTPPAFEPINETARCWLGYANLVASETAKRFALRISVARRRLTKIKLHVAPISLLSAGSNSEHFAMRADQIMSRHVVAISAKASIGDAINTMLYHHIRGLPVVDSTGKLTGMLTEGDFIRRVELGTEKRRGRWLAMLAGTEQAAIDFTRQHGRSVSEIMSPNPISIAEDTPLEQIVRLMESRDVHRFPVMRGEQIVGMVTRSDFLNAMAGRSLEAIGYSDSDDQMRKSVVAALSNVAWRPCGLNVAVHEGVVTLRGTVRSDNARKAALVAAENVRGVRRIDDQMSNVSRPPPEEDYGGGDFVSLQAESSTADDEPL